MLKKPSPTPLVAAAVAPVAAQGSHQLAATAGADGLAVMPDGVGVDAGGEVEVLLLAPGVTLTRTP